MEAMLAIETKETVELLADTSLNPCFRGETPLPALHHGLNPAGPCWMHIHKVIGINLAGIIGGRRRLGCGRGVESTEAGEVWEGT